MATSLLAKPQEHLSIEDLKGVAEKAGEFIKEAPEEADHLPAHIHAFREEFKELLDAADIDQLVVIVDDLDRCLRRRRSRPWRRSGYSCSSSALPSSSAPTNS